MTMGVSMCGQAYFAADEVVRYVFSFLVSLE